MTPAPFRSARSGLLPSLGDWWANAAERRIDGEAINIVLFGDSTTEGAGGAAFGPTFRGIAHAALGNGGRGYVPYSLGHTNLEAGLTLGYTGQVSEDETTFDPDGDANDAYAPVLYAQKWASGSGTDYCNLRDDLAPPSTAVIYYLQQPGGGTFVFGNSGNQAGRDSIDTDGTLALMSATHSETWGATEYVQAAKITGQVRLFGVDLQAGSGGVRVHNAAQGGVSLTQTVALDVAAFQTWLTGIGCDLAVINLGMNDYAEDDSTADTYATNLDTLVTRIRTAAPHAGVLMQGMNDTSDDTKNARLAAYRARAVSVGRDHGGAFHSDRLSLGSYPEAHAAGLMFDGTHTNAAGNSRRAASLWRAIGGPELASIVSGLR